MSLTCGKDRPVRSLILNGAGAGTGETNLIALMEDEQVLCSENLAGRGAAERFAPVVQNCLEHSGWQTPPDQVIAVIGPGSFTGLRASLSLAAGLARGWSCPARGVRLGDALRETAQASEAVVICLARKGRVFIDPPQEEICAAQIEALHNVNWSLLAGDGVYGADALEDCVGNGGLFQKSGVKILPFAAPDALGIYRAAARAGNFPLHPLYIDPPEARLPAQGLRPAPV